MTPKELAKVLREEADKDKNPKLTDSAWVGMLTLADDLDALAPNWGHMDSHKTPEEGRNELRPHKMSFVPWCCCWLCCSRGGTGPGLARANLLE